MSLFWRSLRYLVLLYLIFLFAYASHPDIIDASRALGMESGTVLSDDILKVFAILFIMCLNIKSFFRSGVIIGSVVIFFTVIVFFLLVISRYNDFRMFEDIRSIGICLAATMIGWQLGLNEKKLRFLLFFFTCCIGYVTYLQVVMNVGGFEIADTYLTDNKNSLGAMLATGVFTMVFLQSNMHGNGLKKLLYVLMVLSFTVLLLTIRARTATATLVLLFFFFYYQKFRRRGSFLLFFLGIIIVVSVTFVLFPLFREYVWNSFVQNYEGGDITSGRMERNVEGLRFLSEHLWAGELEAESNLEWIHNYPLNTWCSFGLFFSIPIMLYYTVTLCLSFFRSCRFGTSNIYNVGYFAMLIPFVISMAEPTYTFGPGTATVFNFILFGIALKNTYVERHTIRQ
jgi:hypothetical protein